MKIAIVAGVVVEHDAISAAAVGQAEILASLPGVTDVCVFAQNIDRSLPCRSVILHDPWDLICHPMFAAADVVIMHWGIYYDLFNAAVLAAAKVRVVVHFHNCTPRELVPESDQAVIDRSLVQMHHAISLDLELWTFSEFNRQTLLDWGADANQIAFVPFRIEVPRAARLRRTSRRVEFLVVGRRVPSKGLHLVLQALSLIPKNERQKMRVRLVGGGTFSNKAYAEHLVEYVASEQLGDCVEFVDAPDDDQLWRLYQTSDVVVSASLHEGLCVPIIEGYASGCRAIGNVGSNLAYVVQDPDPRVPVNDSAALAVAMRTLSREIDPAALRTPLHQNLIERYSRASVMRHLQRRLHLALEPDQDLWDSAGPQLECDC